LFSDIHAQSGMLPNLSVTSLFYFALFQGCLSLSAVKTAFQEMGHELGSRDCKAMAVSALTGLVLYDDKSFV